MSLPTSSLRDAQGAVNSRFAAWCWGSLAQLPPLTAQTMEAASLQPLFFLAERGETFPMNALLDKNMQFWTGLNYSYILDLWPKKWIFKNTKMSHFDIF